MRQHSTFVSCLLLLSACTQEIHSLKMDEVVAGKTYLAVSTTLRGKIPGCIISLRPFDEAINPLYLTIPSGKKSVITEIPAGKYEWTHVSCGNHRGLMDLTKMTTVPRELIVTENAINYAGTLNFMLTFGDDVRTLTVDPNLIEKQARQDIEALFKKSLPLYNAFTAKKIKANQFDPISKYNTTAALEVGFDNKLENCIAAEKSRNQLFIGEAAWTFQVVKGAVNEPKLSEPNVLHDDFNKCVATGLKGSVQEGIADGSYSFAMAKDPSRQAKRSAVKKKL